MSKLRYYAAAASLLVLAGCADSADRVVGPRVPAVASLSATAGANANDVARAFALALARPEVRVQVRNAMRASRVTEHKLVLQEFVATPAGQHLVRAAAEATGQSVDAIRGTITALPPLDFYAPSREHRLTWRATPQLLVGAIRDKADSTLLAHAPDGTAVTLHARGGFGSLPLFVLTPAERKSERIDAQPDGPGDVIQDRNDGELSGTYEWVGPDGKTHTVSLAAMKRLRRAGAAPRDRDGTLSTMMMDGGGCDPLTAVTECPDGYIGGGGGGIGAPQDTTFLQYLKINYTDGSFDRNCELEFETIHFVNGQEVKRGRLRQEGVYPYREYYPDEALIPSELNSATDKLRISVKETDLIDDDEKGSREFTWGDYDQYNMITNDWWFGVFHDTTRLQFVGKKRI